MSVGDLDSWAVEPGKATILVRESEGGKPERLVLFSAKSCWRPFSQCENDET